MCTLRNFPNEINHCIEYARDLFNKLFFDIPNDLTTYIDKPAGFVSQLKANTTSAGVVSSLSEIKKLVEYKRQADFKMCV